MENGLVNIGFDTLQKVRIYAVQNRKRFVEVIREAINEYLERKRSNEK
jgi:hypothetical protein